MYNKWLNEMTDGAINETLRQTLDISQVSARSE